MVRGEFVVDVSPCNYWRRVRVRFFGSLWRLGEICHRECRILDFVEAFCTGFRTLFYGWFIHILA